MTGNDTNNKATAKTLIVAVAVLAVVVLGLGAAVVTVALQQEDVPRTQAERDLNIWERLANDNPDEAWIQTGFGKALIAAGKTEEATAALTRAVELDPDQWEALMRLGLLLRSTDVDNAAQHLSSAAERAPAGQKTVPYTALGDLLLESGDAVGASEAYRGAIDDDPLIYSSHLGLGQALEILGDVEGALTAYRRAGDFNPQSQEVSDAIARLGGSDE